MFGVWSQQCVVGTVHELLVDLVPRMMGAALWALTTANPTTTCVHDDAPLSGPAQHLC